VLWNGSRQDIERLVRMDGMKQVADPTNRPLILLAPHFIGWTRAACG